MTASRCAAKRQPQSMTARWSFRRKRNCWPPRSTASGCWHCGTRCPVSRRGEGLATERLPDPEPRGDPQRPSKQDVVIAMLRQPEGATVDEVASVTGWQRHTVRGVFSGTLKKKLGLTLASANEERGRVYRIAEPASA